MGDWEQWCPWVVFACFEVGLRVKDIRDVEVSLRCVMCVMAICRGAFFWHWKKDADPVLVRELQGKPVKSRTQTHMV